MLRIKTKIQILPLTIGLILIASCFFTVSGQDQRWIRVGETQCFFKDFGAEPETTPENFLTWPSQYGNNQHTTRMKALWIGATNFDDPVADKIFSIKVIGSGPRFSDNQFTMIFPHVIIILRWLWII